MTVLYEHIWEHFNLTIIHMHVRETRGAKPEVRKGRREDQEPHRARAITTSDRRRRLLA
jgi:hypothetical protein